MSVCTDRQCVPGVVGSVTSLTRSVSKLQRWQEGHRQAMRAWCGGERYFPDKLGVVTAVFSPGRPVLTFFRCNAAVFLL